MERSLCHAECSCNALSSHHTRHSQDRLDRLPASLTGSIGCITPRPSVSPSIDGAHSLRNQIPGLHCVPRPSKEHGNKSITQSMTITMQVDRGAVYDRSQSASKGTTWGNKYITLVVGASSCSMIPGDIVPQARLLASCPLRRFSLACLSPSLVGVAPAPAQISLVKHRQARASTGKHCQLTHLPEPTSTWTDKQATINVNDYDIVGGQWWGVSLILAVHFRHTPFSVHLVLPLVRTSLASHFRTSSISVLLQLSSYSRLCNLGYPWTLPVRFIACDCCIPACAPSAADSPARQPIALALKSPCCSAYPRSI